MSKGYQFVWTNPFGKPDDSWTEDVDMWFYVRQPVFKLYRTKDKESLYYIFDWILCIGYLQIRKWSTRKFKEEV